MSESRVSEIALPTYRFVGRESEDAHFEACFGGEWVLTSEAWKTIKRLEAELAQLREQLVKAETRISEITEAHDAVSNNCHTYQFVAIDLGNKLAAAEAKIARAKDVIFWSAFTPSNQVKQLVLVDEIMEALADTEAQ